MASGSKTNKKAKTVRWSDSGDAAGEVKDQVVEAGKEEVVTGEAEAGKKKPHDKKKKVGKKKKLELKKEKKEKFEKAIDDVLSGRIPNIKAAAKAHGLQPSSLRYCLDKGGYQGHPGFKSKSLTEQEETKIIEFIKWKKSIGYGMSWEHLQHLLQESMLALTRADPTRVTGHEKTGQLPHRSWVRRFAARHKIVLRRSAEISKGRQVVSPEEIAMWQADLMALCRSKPGLLAALQDPDRVANMDETAVEVGLSGQAVLSSKGDKVVYSVTSSTRLHITAAYTVTASGKCVPPRLVFKGVRNMAQQHLRDLPKDGLSGEWKFSVSDKGYVVQVGAVHRL